MNDLKKRFFKKAALILGGIALISSAGYSLAQQKEVTIAYIPIVGPFSAAIANGDFEKGTGYKINWRQFDSGAKVAAAMASGVVAVWSTQSLFR